MTKELTLTEFRTIIREEAMKLKRRLVLENEKKQLQKELDELLSESYVDDCGEIDEANLGVVGRLFGHEGSYEADIKKSAKKLNSKLTNEKLAELLSQMKEDNGQGFIVKDRKTDELFYKPSVKVAPHGAGAPGGGFSTPK